MQIRFWGVRGSIPTPISSEFLEEKILGILTGIQGRDVSTPETARTYLRSLPIFQRGTMGGNTSCVEIQLGDQHLIIDAGSGIKELGWHLMQGAFGKGEGRAHILISHTHWDHIVGFPYFQPAYVPGNEIFLYGAHPRLKQRFQNQHHTHNFPIPMDVMASNLHFQKMTPGTSERIAGLNVVPFKLIHPGDSFAYRIEYRNKTLVYASDGSYNDPSPEAMKKYHDFYRDADVLVFDAFFDLIQSFEKSDWGHSSSFIGIDIALHAGVKKLVLYHHDPQSDDRRLQDLLDSTQSYLNHVAPNSDCEVIIAYEGLEIQL